MSLSARIGLEVHVQLRTRSKLFCACSAAYGAAPNTQVCEVCYGLPGALPVTNRAAVALALRAAVALDFRVHELSAFSRKHYFYPDLPRGYQITQHERPLATRGALRFDVDGRERTLALRRLQLEEDSGRSLHDVIAGATALDFNRAGVPLVEIVTEPELTSPAEARAFLLTLRRTLEQLEVSDCNMEEGSLRVDANVSVSGAHGTGARTEIKNLNSFSGVERALAYELERQGADVRRDAATVRETRLWDAADGVTRPLRAKEETEDYRYLVEPDLPPLRITAGELEEVRRSIPELPHARAARLAADYRLPRARAGVLTSSSALADRFEAIVKSGVDASLVAGWLLGEERAASTRTGGAPLSAARLAELLTMLEQGRVTRTQARAIAGEMQETGRSAGEVVADRGACRVDDPSSVEGWARAALEANPGEVRRYRGGEHRLLDFFMGRAMGLSRGSADPELLRETLTRLLAG